MGTGLAHRSFRCHILNNRTSAFSATRRFPMSSSCQCMASSSVQMTQYTGCVCLRRHPSQAPEQLGCLRTERLLLLIMNASSDRRSGDGRIKLGHCPYWYGSHGNYLTGYQSDC